MNDITIISCVALIPLVGVFSFLAAGFAMLLLCAAISWSVFQLAAFGGLLLIAANGPGL